MTAATAYIPALPSPLASASMVMATTLCSRVSVCVRCVCSCPATLHMVAMPHSTASAEDEYEFRFDDPVDGEGNIDPESVIYLKVEIENYLDIMHEFELHITNSEDLGNSGIEAWWSNDGQDNVSSAEATYLSSVEVPDSSVRDGITITVSATGNALYGTNEP